MSLITQVLNGRYEIVKLIGEGGLARVYRALDLKEGGVVAVKVVEPRGKNVERPGNASVAEEQLRDRFEQEVKINRALSGKSIHILPFEDSGMHVFDDMVALYLVMPLIEGGRTLEDVIEEYKGKYAADKPITGSFVPLPRAVDLMMQAGQGLRDAHAAGVVHRDFKPSNVLVHRDSRGHEVAMVMDFGIARYYDASVASIDKTLTQLGSCVGTPLYMSPQQAYGPNPNGDDARRFDKRNDLWSFGVTLFEILTGHMPFPYGEGNVDEVWAQVYHGTIEPAPISRYCEGIPVELERLVAKCLKHELEDRPANMEEVLAIMQRVQLKLPPAGASTDGPSLYVPPSRSSDAYAATDFHESDKPPARKTPDAGPSIEVGSSMRSVSSQLQAAARSSSVARITVKPSLVESERQPTADKGSSATRWLVAAVVLLVGGVAVAYVASYAMDQSASRAMVDSSAPKALRAQAAPNATQSSSGVLPAASANPSKSVAVPSSGPIKRAPSVPYDTRRNRDPTSAPE